MRQFLVYNGLRLLILVATFAVVSGVWLLASGHLDWFWSLVIALLVSGLLSYRLLASQRAAFAAQIDARAHRAVAAFEALRAKDDAEVDAKFEAARSGEDDQPR